MANWVRAPPLEPTVVKYIPLTLLISAVTTLILAAPRLAPKPEFVSHDGAGGNVATEYDGALLDKNFAGQVRRAVDVELVVNFAVRGPAGDKYTVELWVEANGTGEKARLISRQEVTLRAPEGAKGRFSPRCLDRIKDRKRPPDDFLQQPYIGSGWSYRLLLKRGKDVVADTGSHYAHYTWRKIE
jgi:hypothetical protein